MKQDEYNLFLDIDSEPEMAPKRRGYLFRKWHRRGWVEDMNFTDEGNRIQDLCRKDLWTMIYPLDGRVVKLEFIQNNWGRDEAIGILEDHGDNGWSLFTTKTTALNYSYSFNSDWSDVAYIDLHPNPRKIWQRLNRLAWDKRKEQDRFHQKMHTMSPGIHREYGSDYTVSYTHPDGNIGDCFPYCQCRNLQ